MHDAQDKGYIPGQEHRPYTHSDNCECLVCERAKDRERLRRKDQIIFAAHLTVMAFGFVATVLALFTGEWRYLIISGIAYWYTVYN